MIRFISNVVDRDETNTCFLIACAECAFPVSPFTFIIMKQKCLKLMTVCVKRALFTAKAGKCGIAPITRVDTECFKVKLAAEVKDLVVEDHLDKREAKKMARFTQLALIAAAEAACAACGVQSLTGKIATGDLFVGDSATKAAIEAKCAPDCVEMEGAAVSQIAAKNGVPCVILRAMSDNADEDGHEVLVVKKFSIAEYVATATKIVAAMVEAL